jgi:hypothetical protein
MSNVHQATREQVANALFAKLKSALSQQFTTIGRKHVLPAPEQQPALFQCGTKQIVRQKGQGFPGTLAMTFLLFIYAYDTAGDEVPGQETSLVETTINGLVEAVESAIAPVPAGDHQSLGGLVSHCWIEGESDIDPGIFGKQGFAVVPVHVLVP